MAPKSPEEFEKMRAESRSNILNSALRLFAEQGYDNTSIANIARDAGISKGLVYNYFESKQHLLQEVINEGMRRMPDLFTSDQDIQQVTLEEVLNRFRHSLQKDQLFWKFYAELLLQVLRKKELVWEFDHAYQQFIQLFIDLMRDYNIDHAELEGRKLAALLDGMALHSMFDDQYPLDEMFDYLIKSYSHALSDD